MDTEQIIYFDQMQLPAKEQTKNAEVATRASCQNYPIDCPRKIELTVKFSEQQYNLLIQGYIPGELSRWFIYHENGWLYFHRSWTGLGIYRAKLVKQPEGGACIIEFEVERKKEKYKCDDDRKDAITFIELIAFHLLDIDGRELILPPSSGDVLEQWSTFGRAKFKIDNQKTQNNEN
jgi:hypothetical protein